MANVNENVVLLGRGNTKKATRMDGLCILYQASILIIS